MLGTLLHFVREAVCNSQCQAPPWLDSTLNPRNKYMTISTIRIPDFTETMENPLNGYRHLGRLPSFDFVPIAPKLHPDMSNEVFAMEIDNPLGKEFVSALGAFEFDLTSIFIIIVTRSSNSHSPSQSQTSMSVSDISPSRSSSSASHLGDSSDFDVDNPQTLLFTGSDVNFNFPVDISIPHSLISSPLPGAPSPFSPSTSDPTHGALSNSSSSFLGTAPELPPLRPLLLSNEITGHSTDTPLHSTLHSPLQTVGRLPSPSETTDNAGSLNFPEGTSLSEVVQRLGVTAEELRKAMFHSAEGSSKSLYDMVQNLRSLSILLQKLGLPGYRDDPNASGKRVFDGGCTITSAEVLIARSWNVKSYCSKAAAYRWAEEAAEMYWTGDPPLQGESLTSSSCLSSSGVQLTFFLKTHRIPHIKYGANGEVL